MFNIEEEIKASNELTEKRIRDNIASIDENSDKWEEIYQDNKPYNYVEIVNDKELYLERELKGSDWRSTIHTDNSEELFKYLICRVDPRANVDYYLSRKSYDLINY